MINKRFHRLIVIDSGPIVQYKSGNKRSWLCLCDCGKTTQVITSKLKNGSIKSCGCLRNETNKINSQTTKSKRMKDTATLNILIGTYKQNAIARGLEFDLTTEELVTLFSSSCHYCGAPPSNIQRNRDRELIYTGIDRVDNSLGYFPQNVVPCCKQCNKAKGVLGEQDFLSWVESVSTHQRLKHELKCARDTGQQLCPNEVKLQSKGNAMQLNGNINDYLEATHQTAIYPDAGTGRDLELYYLSLGLTSEAGEVAGKVKKLIRDGKLNQGDLAYELGDVFWYLARLCDAIGYSPADVMDININKLLKRKESGTIQGSGDNR